jgi:DNA-directed RNA polymerase I, II, and III subunit RPABC1
MSSNTQLIPVYKNPETIRKEVLKNCIKMLKERKLIDDKDLDKQIVKTQIPNEEDIYIIDINKAILPDSDDKVYMKDFDGNKVVIKIIHQKIQGLSKSPVIKDVIDKYKKYHKIFIVDMISDKAKQIVCESPNTEVFNESFLMINLIEHIDSPKYEILNEEEGIEVLDSYLVKKKELLKTLLSDPVSKYYNLKRGQIIRVIRFSEQSGYSIAYRIVING